jgi:biopolymer transport protein ExbD
MAGSVSDGDGDMGFQIAPMIDVVFVLVLYFMANVGMQVGELELSVDLPATGAPVSGADVAATPHFIEISATGQVSLNNEPLDNPTDPNLPQLRAQLVNLMAASPEDQIIIRPADNTEHDRVVDVLNAAAAAKVKKLTFS